MAVSDFITPGELDRPQQVDLDKCVHCGLCLNACPTYRELRVEMDSPRGRIYQMVQIAGGAPITDSYREHIDLCLACRAARLPVLPGFPMERLVEAARADIENRVERPWHERFLRSLVFRHLLPSRTNLRIAASLLKLYELTGLKKLVRSSGLLSRMGRMGELESLSPDIETPFFYGSYGKTFPAHGKERYRVAFLGGCMANVSFARLNEATVRVLQKNGCNCGRSLRSKPVAERCTSTPESARKHASWPVRTLMLCWTATTTRSSRMQPGADQR